MLWFISMAKNEHKHNSKGIQPVDTIVQITTYLERDVTLGKLKKQYFSCSSSFYQILGGVVNQISNYWRIIQWRKPNHNTIKINNDKSYFYDRNNVGIRGIFKDSNGYCLLYFASLISPKNSLHSETLACYMALRILALRPQKHYQLEIDSMTLIHLLKFFDASWFLVYTYKKIKAILKSPH